MCSSDLPFANSNDGEVHVYRYVSSDTIESPIGSMVPGQDYTINSLGTTDFTLLGAPLNAVGVKFKANTTGNTRVGEFVVGKSYTITSTGTTDFTLLGAAVNSIGEVFTATSAGNIAAGNFVPGQQYKITSVGSTNFANIGATASGNFVGNINYNVLTVSAISHGAIYEGAYISGTNVLPGERSLRQLGHTQRREIRFWLREGSKTLPVS